jgi:hypothetical protein
VPQDAHGDPGMNVERRQERGTGAPHAVRFDIPDSGGAAPQHEVPEEVPRLIGRAVARSDDKAGVMPGLADVRLPAALLLGLELDGGEADARQRQRCVGARGAVAARSRRLRRRRR